MRIDLDKTLEHAEGLFLQLDKFKSLPANICEILGLPTNEKLSKDDFEDDKLIRPDENEEMASQLHAMQISKSETQINGRSQKKN